jgi:erythromycin esterase-like protein
MRNYFTKGPDVHEKELVDVIQQHAIPLPGKTSLKPLFDKIGDARIVMLGEASHGTHEYYTWRAYISQKLIEEKGFNCIAVEGDWPDAYRLNRFIKGYDTQHKTAIEIMSQFDRWPTWMWANWEMVALADWLRNYNTKQTRQNKVGFYGLDVYSLWESMESIMEYLDKTDPAAMSMAEDAFKCFEPYRKGEGLAYGRASRFVPELCRTEVRDLLTTIRERRHHYNTDAEHVLSVEQNAQIAVNAEEYYRIMLEGGPHSWNLRDKHMADTMDRLLEFHGPDSKIIVWAHNTHIGDARATDMVDEGMFNLGEIARIKHHREGVVLVGFGSYKGSVIAGRSWGSEMHKIPLPPARVKSLEHYMHLAGSENKLLLMDEFYNEPMLMEHHIGHRAVGVVYDPKYEEYGNYVPTILPLRYDAFIHLDETNALFPLHIKPHGAVMPETYPFGV